MKNFLERSDNEQYTKLGSLVLRLKSLDILRGLAIIMMGQYHFMRWFIEKDSFPSLLYTIIYIPGKLSAPFFLMISGMGAMMMYENYLSKQKTHSEIFLTTLKRGLFLIALTLPLNMAAIYFFDSGGIWEWNIFQLVGVGMLGTIVWGRFKFSAIILSFLIVYICWRLNIDKGFLTAGVAPIIPWLNYYIVGAFLGKLFIILFKHKAIDTIVYGGALVFLCLIVILCLQIDSFVFHVGHKQRLEPNSMAIIALLFASSLFFIEVLIKKRENIFSWVLTLGMIPLSVYYSHLFYKYIIVVGAKLFHIQTSSWGAIHWACLNIIFWIPALAFINAVWKKNGFKYSVEYFMSRYISKRSNIK